MADKREKEVVEILDETYSDGRHGHSIDTKIRARKLLAITAEREPVVRVGVSDPTGYGPSYDFKVVGDIPYGTYDLYLAPQPSRELEERCGMQRLTKEQADDER